MLKRHALNDQLSLTVSELAFYESNCVCVANSSMAQKFQGTTFLDESTRRHFFSPWKSLQFTTFPQYVKLDLVKDHIARGIFKEDSTTTPTDI